MTSHFDYKIYCFDYFKRLPDDSLLWSMIDYNRENFIDGCGIDYINTKRAKYLNLRGYYAGCAFLSELELGSTIFNYYIADSTYYKPDNNYTIYTNDTFKTNNNVSLGMSEIEFAKLHFVHKLKKQSLPYDYTLYTYYDILPADANNIFTKNYFIIYTFHCDKLIHLKISTTKQNYFSNCNFIPPSENDSL